MAKKKSKTASVRPKRSPYTSFPATVHFGVDRQPYYVPDVLLQTLENLPIRNPWTSEMVLEDVDADTGHVLIHFLHTGTYQTLSNESSEAVESPEPDTATDTFQKAVRALQAATKYGLPGLQQLAHAEMERHGADMDLHEAVRAITEENVAGSLAESSWLQEFVSLKVRAAFEHNAGIFSEPDFFEAIVSPTLTKVLARSVVGLYSEKVAELQREMLADGKHSSSEDAGRASGLVSPDLSQMPSSDSASGPGGLPDSLEQFRAFGNSDVACDPQALHVGISSIPEVNASEPTAQPVKKKKSSKKATMLQKIAGDAQINATTSTPAQILPASVVQEATDAVVETAHVEAEVSKMPEEVDQTLLAPAPDSLTEPPTDGPIPPVSVVEDMTSAASSAPLVKKKKKKMHSSTKSPDSHPTPAAEPILDGPPAEPFQGLIKKQIKRLKKEQEQQLADEEAERLEQELQETERLRLLEEEQAAKRAADDVFASEAAEAAAAAAAEAEAEKKQDDRFWEQWGGAAVRSKKKKKKKVSPSEVPAPSPPEPPPPTSPLEPEVVAEQPPADDGACPPPVEETEGMWGLGIKKKKKKSKKFDDETHDESPPPEPEPAPGSDLIEPYPVVEHANGIPSTAETIEVSENNDCPLRLKHLSEGDGWKTCRPCEAYMRGIAFKLHSAGLVGVNGFSAVQ
ncbi:uncharacterized protein EKO05_0007116 [Ascochyta rabiei]|uniref:Uncharacterized protein n=1 Tax=Didymella rabiei TaxID=5454 RepID=A0A163G6D4_DIDRA|nr:uncharacterized protein EKO05_0007116 [Ascochyta rabiei]KZM24703.1 hypothetical protein ST47_g4137 [Ascochyta rabiei]UPX16729.1 hypothetical protein EKO05_0007116 [Ascochyta rabiei]